MQKKYKNVIKNYFSDYIEWLLIVTFLMIISFIAALYFNHLNKFIWVIPVSFVIIYLLSLPLLILYIRARTDIQKHSVKKAAFHIADLRIENNYTFKNRGGTIIGKIKYRIFDDENNGYLLCASVKKEPFWGFDPAPDFSVEIEYLETSKLVLSMKIQGNQHTPHQAHKQAQNINLFKRVFKIYF